MLSVITVEPELTDSTDENDLTDSMDENDPSSEQKEASETTFSAKGRKRVERGCGSFIIFNFNWKIDFVTVPIVNANGGVFLCLTRVLSKHFERYCSRSH